ncbi:MAG: hypothetical protein K6L81_06140 [Agarilytica sp.]
MKKVIVFTLLIVCAFRSYAETFSCSGKVKNVAIGPTTAILQVNSGYGMHYLCSFKEVKNGVDPETCKAWYSMFLAAQASKREVSQSYSTSSGETCASLGSWVTPDPFPYFVNVLE